MTRPVIIQDKHPIWLLGAVGALVLVASLFGLRHALANIPTRHRENLHQLAAQADARFSEASLRRFGDAFDPGALALARRYAPAPLGALAKPAPPPAELSYDNDPGPLPQGFRDLTPQQAAIANAAVAFSKAPNPAAKPFQLPALDYVSSNRALDCLTMAVYYEAASESDEGQAAVAQVVLNRLRHPLFPKTVCGVVFEGSKLPTGCQFSFTCDGSLARRPSEAAWDHARQIASRALSGNVVKSIGDATHYHTMWVVPYWQPSVVKLTQIGAHIFYRWSGEMGLPSAFHMQYAGVEEKPPSLPGLVGDIKPVAAPVAAVASPPPVAVQAPAPAPLAPAPTLQVADVAPAKAVPAALGVADTAGAKSDSWFGPPAKVARHSAASTW